MLSPYAPVRILTFAKSLHEGGVERALMRLIRGWVGSGQRVTLALGSLDGPHVGDMPDGVDLVRVDGGYLRLMQALPGIARRTRPGLIFCPGNAYSFGAAVLRAQLGRDCPPIVAKVSNRLDRSDQRFPLRQGYRAWLRAHPGFMDHMVAMTPAMAGETVAMTGIRADRVSVIANPPAHDGAGALAPSAAGGDYLIGIGRLAPQKRWDRAIDALAGVARRDVRLTILGEGDERPSLEHRAGALGIGDRVRLPGYAADPRPALAGARALVLTSDFEGVPGVLQEALAVGTPVVTTDSSVAIREIVSDSRLGSVVPTGDAQALVGALDYWLAPGRPRPDPVPERGHDSVERYVRLFEELVLARRLARA